MKAVRRPWSRHADRLVLSSPAAVKKRRLTLQSPVRSRAPVSGNATPAAENAQLSLLSSVSEAESDAASLSELDGYNLAPPSLTASRADSLSTEATSSRDASLEHGFRGESDISPISETGDAAFDAISPLLCADSLPGIEHRLKQERKPDYALPCPPTRLGALQAQRQALFSIYSHSTQIQLELARDFRALLASKDAPFKLSKTSPDASPTLRPETTEAALRYSLRIGDLSTLNDGQLHVRAILATSVAHSFHHGHLEEPFAVDPVYCAALREYRLDENPKRGSSAAAVFDVCSRLNWKLHDGLVTETVRDLAPLWPDARHSPLREQLILAAETLTPFFMATVPVPSSISLIFVTLSVLLVARKALGLSARPPPLLKSHTSIFAAASALAGAFVAANAEDSLHHNFLLARHFLSLAIADANLSLSPRAIPPLVLDLSFADWDINA